jgi:hypothetical protein
VFFVLKTENDTGNKSYILKGKRISHWTKFNRIQPNIRIMNIVVLVYGTDFLDFYPNEQPVITQMLLECSHNNYSDASMALTSIHQIPTLAIECWMDVIYS